MSELDRLRRLCGLGPNDLAEVLENNPRAYMAVKGAVAEQHLKNHLNRLKNQGSILDFRMAENDFEKDFYVTLLDGSKKIVECKNVEVQKVSTKSDYLNYLRFLQSSRSILPFEVLGSVEDYSLHDLKKIFATIPQSMRESGIPRYEFSAQQIKVDSVSRLPDSEKFLDQFDHANLSIDFQKTRNSRDVLGSDEDAKAARFYKLDEIDIVAACLFSRTMNWEFVFGSKKSFLIHSKYNMRFSNRLILNPKMWHYNFVDVLG